MPLGINNVTSVTWDNISNLVNNTTSYPHFGAQVNHQVYGGILYFVILWVLLIVIYFKLQDKIDQPLINLMYSSSLIAVVALFLRAIEIVESGVTIGLVTDFQMWIFPVLAILLAGINWAIKDRQ